MSSLDLCNNDDTTTFSVRDNDSKSLCTTVQPAFQLSPLFLKCLKEQLQSDLKINYKGNRPEKSYQSTGHELICNTATTLKSHKCKWIKTGTQLEIPEGYFGLITSRAYVDSKTNYHVITNTANTNDELLVQIQNDSNNNITIEKNERVAQIIFLKHENIQFV